MDIEVRISDLNQLNDVISYGIDCDIIGVGDEGCVYKLPSPDDLPDIVDKVEETGLEFRLVTPFVPQSHFKYVFSLIQKLSELKNHVNIVINDYGLLHASQRLNIRNPHFIIGHFLSATHEASPWFELMVSQESEFVKNICAQNFLNDSHLNTFLKRLGVVGIEAECLPNEVKSLQEIHERGLYIGLLLDFVPVTFSRVCHTSRFYRLHPPKCRTKCNSPLVLQITHYREWWIPRAEFKEISYELRQRIPKLYVYGNIVYRKSPIKLNKKLDFVDYVILDVKFYSLKELSEEIRNIRKLT